VARPRIRNAQGPPVSSSLRPQPVPEPSSAPPSAPPSEPAEEAPEPDPVPELTNEPVRSVSMPSLQPLGAPAPMDASPFAASLGFLRREPPEFRAQRESQARRDAVKLLRANYRSSLEGMGLKFREEPPWPPKEKSVEYLPVAGKASPLSQMPYVPQKEKFAKEAASSIMSSSSRRPGRKTHRQETVSTMRDFGRGHMAGPYTIGQIYQEVEADVHHRFPADVRAISGRLGPAILGPGTTRQRRKLPFTHPFMPQNSLSSSTRSLPRALTEG